MDKRRFMLTGFLLLKPPREKFPGALAWLEDAWAFLGANGYAPKAGEPKPRQSVDHVARLDEWQRAVFLDLWKAYNSCPKEHRSGGRNEAAARWGEIAPDGDLARRIIDAAKADARRWTEAAPPGRARKWLQGWLTEQRWTDADLPAAADAAPPESPALRKAREAVASWENILRLKPGDAEATQQLAAARRKLAELLDA